MGKSKKNRAAATKQIQLKSQTTAEAFSFGDPVPVLDRRTGFSAGGCGPEQNTGGIMYAVERNQRRNG